MITCGYQLFVFICLISKGIFSLMHFERKTLSTKSIEDLVLEYEDEKNSMIAKSNEDNIDIYDDFYDELDSRVHIRQSMDMIFFSPPSSFLRLSAETILHILLHTKTHLIPISKVLLAWDIVTDGKTAAFLQGREYLAFGSLLNVVPEEDLYNVNFGDPSVLKYFATNNIHLNKRKYGVLVAAYRRYYTTDWSTNTTYINELGYLFCAFPAFEMQKITPTAFKLISSDVLSKLKRCSMNQTKTLYKIATHPDAYDAPYIWTSHEISRLSSLFACIPQEDISSIQLEAISAITDEVMKTMLQDKLAFFTKEQILRMNPSARRIHILRMQLRSSLDMSQITKRHASILKPGYLFIFIYIASLFSNI